MRTSAAASVAITYSTNPNLVGSTTSASILTSSDADFTAKILRSGLSVMTTYWLNVLVEGLPQLNAPYPQYKTFPLNTQDTDFTVVALTDFCCFPHGYTPGPTNTFRNASNENPDVVLIGGDFDHRGPYGTDPTNARDLKRQMFKDLYTPVPNMEDFVNGILRRYPLAHNWDDHDYATNNADKTYPFKQVSLQVLNEYFPVYSTSPYGDWQSFRYTQAEFFLLDSRSQRDPDSKPGPNKSMLDGDHLGPVGQLDWLENGLQTSTATWKFVVTQVPFNPTVPKNDAWHGYPDERLALIDYIQTHGIANVIIISGDLHAGGIDNGLNSTFPEMVVPSANLTKSGKVYVCLTAPSIGSWSEGTYGDNSGAPCPGYGVIRVLTNPDRVELVVKDSEGNTRIGYTVPSAQVTITSGSSAIFTVRSTGTFTVTASGLPRPSLTEAGALPAGVSFVDNHDGTATLGGTPQAGTGGIYVLTITASNGIAPSASQIFTLTVNPAYHAYLPVVPEKCTTCGP